MDNDSKPALMENPWLTPTPAQPLKATPQRRVLWKWSLVVTLVVVAFLLWQCGSALLSGRRLANASVQRFHEQLNSGRYAEIYSEAAENFRRSGTQDDMGKFFEAVHNKLGTAIDHKLTNLNVTTTTNGTFVTTVYSTTFTRGVAVETFTWLKRGSGLVLNGYNIQSNALITN